MGEGEPDLKPIFLLGRRIESRRIEGVACFPQGGLRNGDALDEPPSPSTLLPMREGRAPTLSFGEGVTDQLSPDPDRNKVWDVLEADRLVALTAQVGAIQTKMLPLPVTESAG